MAPSDRSLCFLVAILSLAGAPAEARGQSESDAPDSPVGFEVALGLGLVEDLEYGVRRFTPRLEGAWHGFPVEIISSVEVTAGRPDQCDGDRCSETQIFGRIAGGVRVSKYLAGDGRSVFAFVDVGPTLPFALSSSIGIGGYLIRIGRRDLIGADVQYRWAYHPGDRTSSRAVAIFLRWQI